jgi:hypothetical protein
MVITLLLMYSLGISFYLLRKNRLERNQSELDVVWQRITSNQNPSVKDVRAIAKIAKARQTEIPWYERSLSTIGIVAFFSMLVATSFQTINSARTEIESSNLKQEIKTLELQRGAWAKLIKDLSEVILLKQTSAGKLEQSEQDVLRQRLGEIERNEKPSKEIDTEQLKIHLALREYNEASTLINGSAFLADETSPEILLFLAEASFVDGARERAKFLLKKFEPSLSKQPVEWQIRFLVLSAAATSEPQSYVKEVAALKRISLNEAEEFLRSRLDELREQARRRSLNNR